MSQKIAMIFPGQGSQTIGMGKSFYENSALAREMFEKAGERIGVDFSKLLFEEMIKSMRPPTHNQQFYLSQLLPTNFYKKLNLLALLFFWVIL
jgi:[acyl-carrier-protein] S-malonyltransferase